MSINSVEPMSPQEYNRGLITRALIGGIFIVIGVIPLVMSNGDGFWSWFAEPAFGDTSRAVVWMVLMVLVECALVMSFTLRNAPRVRAWREQHQ